MHIYMNIYAYTYIYTYEYIYRIRALVNSRPPNKSLLQTLSSKHFSFADIFKKIRLFCKNFQGNTSLLQTLARNLYIESELLSTLVTPNKSLLQTFSRKYISLAKTFKKTLLSCKHSQENTSFSSLQTLSRTYISFANTFKKTHLFSETIKKDRLSRLLSKLMSDRDMWLSTC